MGKNKIKKFEENLTFDHFIQPTREEVLNGFDLKGKWNREFFKKDQPIVVELGCGKGEYTVGLGKMFPEKNFIGIDIKGARIWRGAKTVEEDDLKNVGFVRTQIELINHVFAENEISEIWITFPDPQIKYRRKKHRLTHPEFLDRYRQVLKANGFIHLKTDSEYLHGYTLGIIEVNNYKVAYANHDIYNASTHDLPAYLYDIQTHYEKLYLNEHKKITYLKFQLD
ncbi:tRNA (guanosine(46)-N7)-methyltransferase TrmB [Flavobacteriaceae bacterium Ap0902]|nr:tRNA (guanosine(46)-N7)-methyltransferase TrmB [Flavobacteriaceae bacterium Ap0902]